MDASLGEFFEWGFKGLIGGAGMLGFRFINNQNKKISDVAADLQDHRLHVAETCARDSDMKLGFNKLDGRMDAMGKKIDDGFQNISQTIQTLMLTKK